MEQKREEFYLSYHNADLNELDYHGLKKRQWLTSGSINFYYEHLRQTYAHPKYILLDPSQVQLIITKSTDFSDLVDWFQAPFQSAEYIFIPINNADDFDIPGAGTHWTLLLFEKKTNKYIYFDSNSKSMSNYISKVGQVAQMIYAILNNDKSLIKKDKISIAINNNTPQQTNGYDCGVFVLTITEVLLDKIEKNPLLQTIYSYPQLSIQATQNVVTKQRDNILKLVSELSDEQKQRKAQQQQKEQ